MELVVGLIFLVPIFLYTVDYATVLYGGAMNNNCCTAAARAAASGPPTSYTSNSSNTPNARATSIISQVYSPNSIVRMQTQVRLRETFVQPVPGKPFGGPFLGTCTIKTRCDVYPPFALPWVPADVPLYTSETFPWTWTMPTNYLSGPSPNSTALGGGLGGGASAASDIDLPLPQA